MRNSYMSAKFGYELPVMKEAMDAMRAAGDEPVGRELFAAARAARDRVDAASFTFTLTQGDRKSVVEGKSVYVRVDLGGRRISKYQILYYLRYTLKLILTK